MEAPSVEPAPDARATPVPADELLSLEDVEETLVSIDPERFRDPDPALQRDLAGLDLVESGIDESQADALADGVVTLDEYRTQVERGADCVADTGLVLDPRGIRTETTFGVEQFTYGFGNEGTSITEEEMFRLADDCQGRYFFLLQFVYEIQNGPTPDDTRQLRLEIAQEAWPCMIEAGLQLDDFNVNELTIEEAEEIWVRALSQAPETEACLWDLFEEAT